MKGWRIWFLLALITCLPILLEHPTGPGLLKDTDTAFLLQAVRERHAPLSWFTGDWPLQNHFYRPLPTLTFEFDNWVYGNNPVGYGWTNAILCAICVLALFWFLCEFFESPALAFAGAGLFALWTSDHQGLLALPIQVAIGVIALAGLHRHSFKLGRFLPTMLVLYFLAGEAMAPQARGSLADRIVLWCPGRTASVMTFFALIAAAAYIRYERARNRRLPPGKPTALDRPAATRSGAEAPPKRPMLWLFISLFATGAALASYEQAVMLPAVLTGIGVYLGLTRRKPHWIAHLWFWGILGGYFALRHSIVPGGPSHYQLQQFRHGAGVYFDLLDYALPNVTQLTFLWAGLTVSAATLLEPALLSGVAAFASTVTTFLEARRHWRVVLTGLMVSLLAYLPMAWLKQFGHYHFWPLALRTIFVLGVARVAWDLTVTAVSPPVLQAPPRPSPAPGSLPRQ